MTAEQANETSVRAERLEKHLDRLLELYKHHYGLFVRGSFVYLAGVSVIAGYLFKPDAPPSHRTYFAGMLAVVSAAWVVACLITVRWWGHAADALEKVTADLEIIGCPVYDDRYIMWGTAAVAASITVSSLTFVIVTNT